MKIKKEAVLKERKIEFFTSVSSSESGYEKEQTDPFAVIYPIGFVPERRYGLQVVFHSAGHNVYSAIGTMMEKNNHDVYKVPDDAFGLVLDCRNHYHSDWWWGGINARGEGNPDRCGIQKQPVENRCMATVEWVMKSFPVDPDRVYAVGNSMGGSGALGIAFCRGDMFAAIKVNVPAGVRHMADRSLLENVRAKGFSIPDPPPVLDYSAQNDPWSEGHEVLYRSMRKNKYAFYGFWGNFGHENIHKKIEKKNDLIHSVPILEIKKSQAYPVFFGSDTDDKNPWEFPKSAPQSGQVNGFFRYENRSDEKDRFEMALWLLNPEEWKTTFSLPEKAKTSLLLRRTQRFFLKPNQNFNWKLILPNGKSKSGKGVADEFGHPEISSIQILQEKQILVLTKEEPTTH